MDELKPCPFCGSKEVHLVFGRDHVLMPGESIKDNPAKASVICEVCHLEARFPHGEDTRFVKARWNERHYEAFEENGYFILPKPKDELFTFSTEVVLNDAGKITLNERIDIIRDALDRWKKELGQEMTQRLFETFRPICKALLWEGEEYLYKCSECGGIITLDDFFCSNCGAKVDW